MAVNEIDTHGLHALSYAAWRGHTKVVDFLLARGADPQKQDGFGVSALHKAVGHRRYPTALRLLSDGASDVNQKTGEISKALIPDSYKAETKRQTPLHLA